MITCLGKAAAVHSLRCPHERLSVSVCASFPFDFEDGMWDLVVLVPDHRLSFILYRYSTVFFYLPVFSKTDIFITFRLLA